GCGADRCHAPSPALHSVRSDTPRCVQQSGLRLGAIPDGFRAHCDAPETAGLLPELSHPDQILHAVRPNSPPLLADICDDTLDTGYWDTGALPAVSHRLPAALSLCAFCGALPIKLPHSV